jgi:ABC-2 type transport system permease protein
LLPERFGKLVLRCIHRKEDKMIKKYIRVLWVLVRGIFLTNMNKKLGFMIFFVGKMLRFFLYLFFIYYALSGSKVLGKYDRDQVIFFFLTFTLIDSLGQLLFRNIYTFRGMVVSGSFDFVLLKPVSALFRVLLGGIDMIDAATIPIIVIFCYLWGLRFDPNIYIVISYLVLVVNSLVIIAAFHIIVASFGIITLEVDNLIMIYRDIESMGRFPVDIYNPVVRNVLTFVVPIGIMMTVPAKVFLGLITPAGVVTAFIISAVLLFLSLRFWHFALLRYTSASS